MTGIKARATAGVKAGQDATARARGRWPPLDHAVRAYSRYQEDGGDRLASGVTYFGFLSFFPLVALAFSICGFVVDAYPQARVKLTDQINNYLPGLADKLNVTTIGEAKVGAGLLGIVGLLLSGLGWIDALRAALRILWHHSLETGNIVTRKIRDIGVLVGLGLLLLVSTAVTSLSTSAATTFLGWLNLNGSLAARVATAVLAIVAALAIDVAVFMYLFVWLPRISPRRRVLRGALLGAVGLEVLKVIGTWLIGRTTDNPVYGVFAVIVGLLIWINVVTRWTLFVAAWTVTDPYAGDVPPSGTAPEVPAEVSAGRAGTASPP
ncbi:MAG: YihY/virulence factor BrkB family protein [Frankia sp.]